MRSYADYFTMRRHEWLAVASNAVWIIGVSLSLLGLLLQILIYVLVPCSRKLDQKILTQLTVARILNVMFEFFMWNITRSNIGLRIGLAMYLHTDSALVCWMFAFTKNLYDKVVHVFTQTRSFVKISILIWIATFLLVLPGPFLVDTMPVYHAPVFFVYAAAKLIILIVNVCFFYRIFKVAVTRTNRNVCMLRTCIVSFIVLSLSSAHALSEIVLSLLLLRNNRGDSFEIFPNVFCLLNPYQGIATTTIYFILVNSACDGTLVKTMVNKIKTNEWCEKIMSCFKKDDLNKDTNEC